MSVDISKAKVKIDKWNNSEILASTFGDDSFWKQNKDVMMKIANCHRSGTKKEITSQALNTDS